MKKRFGRDAVIGVIEHQVLRDQLVMMGFVNGVEEMGGKQHGKN